MSLEAALTMQKKRNYKESIRLYREIVEKEPDNIQAQAGLAFSLAAVKEYEQAGCAASQALALDKNSDYAHLALAIVYHAQQQKEKFVDEVERAFYVKPFVFDVVSTYAPLLADEKDITPAFPVFERMIEADTAKECRNYLYGLAYYQLRKPKLAIKHSLMSLKLHQTAEVFSLVVKVIFGLMPFISIPLVLLFFASIAGLVQLGIGLPWYLLMLFIVTYIFSLGSIGALVLSYMGLIGQKKKRSRTLLTITLINVGIFLAIFSSLIF